ncbi:hypothetical protein TIFTF001_024313 [Ficus carica]|uniref:Uncharacterized protein n=1 Tax=Ficus carica TaxID=3494 RepID=A0AA88DD76_FICCA|nr:hypothetical protein TIFTF001_024313 [Ficus carica]
MTDLSLVTHDAAPVDVTTTTATPDGVGDDDGGRKPDRAGSLPSPIVQRRWTSRRRPNQIVSATTTEAEKPDLDGDGGIDHFLLRSSRSRTDLTTITRSDGTVVAVTASLNSASPAMTFATTHDDRFLRNSKSLCRLTL